MKVQISKFHYNMPNDLITPIKFLLKFGSYFYAFVTAVRNFLYDRYILPIECVSAKVISVGNLTTGGVGKTPVVANIANFYANQYQERVCIVSRGYGGLLDNKNVNIIKLNGEVKFDAYNAGDEPYWLAQNTHQDVIVLTCKDRAKACNMALNKFQATKIILDDAFQHRRIHRDSDVVLIDSEMKFGNAQLLPYGPLRENMSGLNRADVIFVVSKNIDHKKAEQYIKFLKRKLDKDIRLCKVEPDIIYNIKTNTLLDTTKPVTALCAIGQPDQFLKFLDNLKVENIVIYEDHYSYTKEDIAQIKGNIITTEKDAVKIKNFGFDNIYALKLKTTFDPSGLLK